MTGKDMSNIKDSNGVYFVREMVEKAFQSAEGGYTEYLWPRLGSEQPIHKISYSHLYKPWNWVIGSGIYVDDVDVNVAQHKQKMVARLRNQLKNISIGVTGHIFLFNQQEHILIHPSPSLEGKDGASLLNPVSQKPLLKEMMEYAYSETPFYYRWNHPDTPEQYTHQKMAWLHHHKGLDWYVGIGMYVNEFEQTATYLSRQILLYILLLTPLLVLLSYFITRRLLHPLKKLSGTAQKVYHGDLDARCKIYGKDEVGVLAAAINRMVDQLSSNISTLDDQVQQRTEELRYTEALQRSETEKYRSLFDGSSDAIMMLTPDGFTDCNPATLSMFEMDSRNEFIHRHPATLSPPHQPNGRGSMELSMEQITKAQQEGSNFFEWVHRKAKSTEDFPCEVLLTNIELSNQTVIQAIVRDISKRKEMERDLVNAKDEAEQASHSKSVFLANMSHEIRTPMNGIIGLSHLALEKEHSPESRELIERIGESADSLLNIINGILDFSKIEAGQMELEQINFSLSEVLEQVSHVTLFKAEEKGVELQFRVDPAVPKHWYGDPTRIRQILVNLNP
jgi:PAS domain S-box-containing protein